ncbi:hypothetical protein [Dictyobacter formicarum]|nr:hypothetical protein [Dictyobacter formicarum]
MTQKKKAIPLQASNISQISSRIKRRTDPAIDAYEICTCVAFDKICQMGTMSTEEDCNENQCVPVSVELSNKVRGVLNDFLPAQEPISVLLLHVVQREAPPLAPQSEALYRRKSYHVAASLLNQVLTHVRRVLRIDDKMFIYDVSGAAIIFPDVDQAGKQKILERIYHSVCLMQAETTDPPLTRETTISLGGVTYPPRAVVSFEQMYYQLGKAQHTLTLRPIISAHTRGVKPMPIVELSPIYTAYEQQEETGKEAGIPYMELPHVLPDRLVRLIPYPVACELQCVPVGREHQYLTVAMREPTNAVTIALLREMTGCSIFPVACEEQELNNLLRSSW